MSSKSIAVPPSIPAPARQLANVVQNLFSVPRQQANSLVEQGFVMVNNKVKRQGFFVCDVGDLITVELIPAPVLAPARVSKQRPLNRVVEFLYDDDALCVVNKPANLLTVPTKHREAHTLMSLVERQLRKSQPDVRAYCVHRLDRGVSGVLVIAKSLEIAEKIRNQFADRKPQRRYIAIVAGQPKPEASVLRSYLATDADLNRFSVPNEAQGELAITHYTTKLTWRDTAMLEVKLETGRRNQIRVQLAEHGHPILGDPRYRPRQAEHWAWPYERLALHAESLGFNHPLTGEPVRIETPWPQEFRDFMRLQKKYSDDGDSSQQER